MPLLRINLIEISEAGQERHIEFIEIEKIVLSGRYDNSNKSKSAITEASI